MAASVFKENIITVLKDFFFLLRSKLIHNVSFCYTQNGSIIYTFLLYCFFIMSYLKILNIVPCATQ